MNFPKLLTCFHSPQQPEGSWQIGSHPSIFLLLIAFRIRTELFPHIYQALQSPARLPPWPRPRPLTPLCSCTPNRRLGSGRKESEVQATLYWPSLHLAEAASASSRLGCSSHSRREPQASGHSGTHVHRPPPPASAPHPLGLLIVSGAHPASGLAGLAQLFST